jgi:putative addiction module component (TIGR02574 family)
VSRPVDEPYKKASELPAEDRAELAGLLLDSVADEPDEAVEDAWQAEVERRVAEYRAGSIKTISWSELRARMHRVAR